MMMEPSVLIFGRQSKLRAPHLSRPPAPPSGCVFAQSLICGARWVARWWVVWVWMGRVGSSALV